MNYKAKHLGFGNYDDAPLDKVPFYKAYIRVHHYDGTISEGYKSSARAIRAGLLQRHFHAMIGEDLEKHFIALEIDKTERCFPAVNVRTFEVIAGVNAREEELDLHQIIALSQNHQKQTE